MGEIKGRPNGSLFGAITVEPWSTFGAKTLKGVFNAATPAMQVENFNKKSPAEDFFGGALWELHGMIVDLT